MFVAFTDASGSRKWLRNPQYNTDTGSMLFEHAGVSVAVPMMSGATEVMHRESVESFLDSRGIHWVICAARRPRAEILVGHMSGACSFVIWPVELMAPLPWEVAKACSRDRVCKEPDGESYILFGGGY